MIDRREPPAQSTIAESDRILGELLSHDTTLSVLSISLSIPNAIYDYGGPLVSLGNNPECRPFASGNLRFLRAIDNETLASAFEILNRERPGVTFDLIFIDHDHRLSSLLKHITLARRVARSDTMFLFDDALPPTISMAGPRPTQAWWVGEVWMLGRLLRQADPHFFALTCASAPTGLLATSGFTLPDAHEIEKHYEILRQVETDADLSKLLSPQSPETFLISCMNALNSRSTGPDVPLTLGLRTSPDVQERIIDHGEEWIKHPPKFVLDMSQKDLDVTAMYRSNRRMHTKTIDTFRNAHLIGSEGVVKNHQYFDHKSDIPHDTRLLRLAEGHGSYNNFGTGVRLADGKVVLPRERIAGARELEGSIMLGTPDELDNWGMWLLLGVPSICEFLENRSKYDKFLAYLHHPWQRALIATFGLSTDDLIEHDHNTCYHFRQLTMVRHSHRDLAISPDDKRIFSEVAERFADQTVRGNAEKIFISRISRTRNMKAYRGLMNEDALIESLSALGFTTIEPELLDFRQQIAVFRAARVVVGLGGAGMFNTVFCRPGLKVVTIESGTTFIDGHTNIFASMGFDYGVILGQEDLTDQRRSQRRWTLDIKAASDQIARFAS